MPHYVVGREAFSTRLAEELGCKYREFRHEYHPDGDPAPRIAAEYGELEGKHVVLVLRGKQLPDWRRVSRNLHNFSRHIDNLKYVFNVGKVDVLMPYHWLGRSDKNPRTDNDPLIRERDQGRDIGYEWLARDFKSHGADRILTFNPHFHRETGEFDIAGLPMVSLSGVRALARYVEKLYADGLVSRDGLITGPDFGSDPLLEEFTGLVNKDFRLLQKKRLDENCTESEEIDAEGKDVLILDDIFATLGTIETAVGSMRNTGYVDCFAVHGVLPEEGFSRLKSMKKKVRRFVTTDSIDNDYSKATIIPEIVDFYNQDV